MCSKLTAVWLIWVQYRQRFDAGELEDAQLPSKKTFLPKTISFFDTQREIFESYLQVIRLYLYLYTFIPTRYSAGKFGAFSCFNTWNITYFNGHFQGEPGLVRRWFFMPPPSQTGRRHSVLYLSVCPSVRPSVTKLVNTIFWKWMNWFWCKLAQVVCEATAWNDQILLHQFVYILQYRA